MQAINRLSFLACFCLPFAAFLGDSARLLIKFLRFLHTNAAMMHGRTALIHVRTVAYDALTMPPRNIVPNNGPQFGTTFRTRSRCPRGRDRGVLPVGPMRGSKKSVRAFQKTKIHGGYGVVGDAPRRG